MMKRLLLGLLAAFPSLLFAQYTTPNTAVNWGLTDLLSNAPAGLITLTDGVYTLSQNLTIAANDTLTLTENLELRVDPNVEITIAGILFADADAILITATNTAAPYGTIRFEEGATGYLRNVTLNYGKGIRVATANFEMDSCAMSYHVEGTTTSAALTFSTGSPLIKASSFTNNVIPAFGSGANIESAPWFIDNYLENNNTSNSNRPQINMGPSGNDTIRIIGNTIKGNPLHTLVGGIAVSSFFGNPNRVRIEGNTISDNRYGITVAGAASSGYIANNVIEDNNTQNNPAQGGSGISLNATGATTMNIIATGNQIRRNLWGITVIGTARINLGSDDPDNPNIGNNIFAENGNGGQIHALYNNTALPISALYNCWIEGQTNLTAQDVEAVITHQSDQAALGLVTFDPFSTNCTLSNSAYAFAQTQIYPNPTNGRFSIDMTQQAQMAVYNMTGQLLLSKNLSAGTNVVDLEVPGGMYLIKIAAGNAVANYRIIKQ